MATVKLPTHPTVAYIQFRNGRFTYHLRGSLANGPAIPPSKRKDLKFAEVKFRYMLRNEAQVVDADRLVDELLRQMTGD